jgi:hypothetical protein
MTVLRTKERREVDLAQADMPIAAVEQTVARAETNHAAGISIQRLSGKAREAPAREAH